jgi:hypothetical protein
MRLIQVRFDLLGPAQMPVAALGQFLRPLADSLRVGELVGGAVHRLLDFVLGLAEASLGLGSLSAQVYSPLTRLLRQLLGLFSADHGCTVGPELVHRSRSGTSPVARKPSRTARLLRVTPLGVVTCRMPSSSMTNRRPRAKVVNR